MAEFDGSRCRLDGHLNDWFVNEVSVPAKCGTYELADGDYLNIVFTRTWAKMGSLWAIRDTSLEDLHISGEFAPV